MTWEPTCPPVHRPAQLLAPGATVAGLRAAGARVSGGSRLVDVWLYGDPSAELADPDRWSVAPPPGGPPVAVTAAAVVVTPAPHVELTLAGEPGTARHRLDVHPSIPGGTDLPFDPLRTWLPVRLRPECPDLDSCFPPEELPPPPRRSPVHDYLARDWRSLRTALLELLRLDDPQADLSPADPTVTLAELFAHVGDLLHYRLDRVATEAYLETARRRASVRRHAHLVDYRLEEAAAATVVVLLSLPPTTPAVPVGAGALAVPEADLRLGFTLEAGRTVEPALGEIAVHDWGEDACCLPEGATSCVLVRPLPADPLGAGWLAVGDLVVLEVIDPEDRDRHRDWAHRVAGVEWPAVGPGGPRFREPLPSRPAQVVRLTGVVDVVDPLAPAGTPLTRVSWSEDDALRRPYPVGIDTGSGGDEVTVVRANLVPAHHGRLVDGPAGSTLAQVDDASYALLSAGVPGTGPGVALRPDGTPHRLEVDVTLPSGDVVRAEPVQRLLTVTGPATLAVALETEDDAPPLLRFRTGAVGLAPPEGSEVRARYEVGGGRIGNVAANTLVALQTSSAPPGTSPDWQPVPGVVARNPVAAFGGRDPEPLDVARRDAPEEFAAVPRRAVLVADHAGFAAQDRAVQRAVSARAWSGSWPAVRTALDLLGADPADPVAQARVAGALDDVRMLGTEVLVTPGTPVALLVALDVCAAPGTNAEALRRRVVTLLRPGTDRRPGLFHPSRLTLGGTVYLSAVVAAVAGLPGVDAVEVREARRLSDPPGTAAQSIHVGAAEVPVLDDDPARPDRGRLDISVRGGR